MGRLKSFLIGRVVGQPMSLNAIKLWGKKAWKLSGELLVQHLPKGLILFGFPLAMEATTVPRNGKRRWDGGGVFLDVWHPIAGCTREWETVDENIILVFGLPIHFWSKLIFSKIEELCGGLVEVGCLQNESKEWVVLKVRRPELATSSVWLLDGTLGYRVAVWRRQLPIVMSLGHLEELASSLEEDELRSEHGRKESGRGSKFKLYRR